MLTGEAAAARREPGDCRRTVRGDEASVVVKLHVDEQDHESDVASYDVWGQVTLEPAPAFRGPS